MSGALTTPRELAHALQAHLITPQSVSVGASHLWPHPPLALPALREAPSPHALNRAGALGAGAYELSSYRRGDDVRLIEWRRYLTHKERVVRRFEAEGVGELLVQLDASATMGVGEGKWSAALGCARAVSEGALRGGARVWWLIERGGEAHLRGPLLGLRSLQALFDELSAFSPQGERASAEALKRSASRCPIGTSHVALTDLLGPDLALPADQGEASAHVKARWALPRGCAWSVVGLLRSEAELTPPPSLVKEPLWGVLKRGVRGEGAQRAFQARLEAHLSRWSALSGAPTRLTTLWWGNTTRSKDARARSVGRAGASRGASEAD
jgi:hypothetical protein